MGGRVVNRISPAGTTDMAKKKGIADRLLLGSSFVLAFLYALRRMSDSDLWAHLKCGEYLFQEGKILTTYHFNCSWPTFPYVNHSWLFQAVIYAVEAVTGEWGLVALQVLLILLAFWLLYRILLLRTDNLVLIACVLSLGIIAASHRFALRPQHFSYLFLLYFLYSLDLFRRGNERPAKLLPFVMVIWVNMHAESLWGVLVMGVFLIVHWFSAERGAEQDTGGRTRLLKVFGLVLVASLVNPFTWKTVVWPLFVMKEQFAGVEEILPPIGIRYVFFYIYFGLVVSSTILNFRRSDPLFLALTVVFSIVAWTANRGVPHFVFVSAPLLTANLVDLGKSYRERIRIPNYISDGIKYVILAAILGSILSILTSPLYLQKFDTVPYPEQALKYLKTRGISGNVFNEHIWGGYIIYRSYPELKPYIDGRFFHKRFYDEFNPILAGRTGWEKAIDHYDISIAILAYSKGDDLRLNDRLFQNPRWRLVFWDDISLVYLKDTEKNRKVLELYGNDLLNPDRDLFAEHTERTLSAVRRLSEIADRNLQYAKDSTKALIVSGNALFALGEYAKARERFQAALSTPQPHDPWIYYKIALCYRAEGDLSNAGEFARRSLQLVPGSQVAQTLLREVQFLQRSSSSVIIHCHHGAKHVCREQL